MSDIEFSPPKHRNNLPLHIDCDFQFKEREPKCVNSLCNLINTRLKVLENEIFTQHKVWEYIQREVDEVKSLIEDCSSTCESSSLSGHENESEVVDSPLESHKTCNSLLWDKIKQAEENVEEKKSLMQILSSDVSKLKNSKKKCKKKLEKINSNIDLILEVTNGLHALKCNDCKFCREHIDFREGLLSSVIELIHFSEKKYGSCMEENKALKSCLQKIYTKTKRCLLHSQTYVRNTQVHNISFETESSSFCTDSIYSSFEEFCQHFQNLQEELMQLKHILLAAEENHLDEVFQSSHSSDCRCYSYSFTRNGDAYLENDYDRNDLKLPKSNDKNNDHYEKKTKSFNNNNEHGDSVPVYEDNLYSSISSPAEKQLDILRSSIFEAVKVIRDVEVVENDDENLINMVTSLAEECSALRQEVSYLRNVRQEKKRAWNKLQCFIMDAERRLIGSNRSITDLREIIKDLGQLIATSESSSLDETVLYMYSNQLEWAEKLLLGCDSSLCQVGVSLYTSSENNLVNPGFKSKESTCISEFTQTSNDICSKTEQSFSDMKYTKCNMSTQTDSSLCHCTVEESDMGMTSFQEINREIYVLPEVSEEPDNYFNSIEDNYQAKLNTENVKILEDQLILSKRDYVLQHQNSFDFNEPSFASPTSISSSVMPLSGSFPSNMKLYFKDDKNSIQVPNLVKNSSILCSNMSFSSRDFFYNSEQNFYSRYQETHNHLLFNSSLYKNFCNNMLYNILKHHIKSIEVYDSINKRSCVVYKSEKNSSPLVLLDRPKNHIPCKPYISSDLKKCNWSVKEILDSDIAKLINQNLYVCDDIRAANVIVNFSILSSISNEDLLPNNNKCDISNENHASINLPLAKVCEDSTYFQNSNNICKENNEIIPINEHSFTLKRSDTFVQEKPIPACREGTFIIDSDETIALCKSDVQEKNFYHTVILTALSKQFQSSDKNYILYEMESSSENSQLFPKNVNPFASNFDSHFCAPQHFILCEAITNNDNSASQTGASNVTCHISFFKKNINQADSLLEKHMDISDSYPLLPQYLPPENFNVSMFDNISLAQSCEIYMCNDKSCHLDVGSENIIFTPKNYYKFKELDPIDQSNSLLSPEKVYCQTVFTQNLAQKFSTTFEKNCDINLNLKKINHEKDLSEITSECELAQKTFSKLFTKETQTDEMHHIYVKEKYFPLETFSDEFQEELKASAEFEEESIVVEQKQYVYNDHRQKECSFIYNHSSQEQAVRETSFVDEIEALKDNLAQQNAVLMRLKDDLDETHFQLAEKEQLLVLLQLDHSRLSTMLAENDVREIDEKECQTDMSSRVYSEDLEKEVYALRQKNIQHHEKIVQQNHTIQSVKTQLCTTISHLKHLKDTATKQLKKQKHYAIKTTKLKQHLYDTRTELEQKCQELKDKNEMLSDQEFIIQEMRVRWDSTIEEFKEKFRMPNSTSNAGTTTDFGCQTDLLKECDFDESNGTWPHKKELDMKLRKHSEELSALNAKFLFWENVFSNKKDHKTCNSEPFGKTTDELKSPTSVKDANIWKLLTISEQSYLNLLNKMSDILQLTDLKGSSALMHSSWLSCEDLANARRHDHKKIVQCIEKMKKTLCYLQESISMQSKRSTADNTPTEDRKTNITCHSEEMHFQYLCEVLQKAQESVVKDFSQKRAFHRTVVTAGSGRTSRHAGSRERRIPLELKNGKILAVLEDKFNREELLPNKLDYSKMECKNGNAKIKTPS